MNSEAFTFYCLDCSVLYKHSFIIERIKVHDKNWGEKTNNGYVACIGAFRIPDGYCMMCPLRLAADKETTLAKYIEEWNLIEQKKDRNHESEEFTSLDRRMFQQHCIREGRMFEMSIGVKVLIKYHLEMQTFEQASPSKQELPTEPEHK